MMETLFKGAPIRNEISSSWFYRYYFMAVYHMNDKRRIKTMSVWFQVMFIGINGMPLDDVFKKLENFPVRLMNGDHVCWTSHNWKRIYKDAVKLIKDDSKLYSLTLWIQRQRAAAKFRLSMKHNPNGRNDRNMHIRKKVNIMFSLTN